MYIVWCLTQTPIKSCYPKVIKQEAKLVVKQWYDVRSDQKNLLIGFIAVCHTAGYSQVH